MVLAIILITSFFIFGLVNLIIGLRKKKTNYNDKTKKDIGMAIRGGIVIMTVSVIWILMILVFS